jgi:hypothetical protein
MRTLYDATLEPYLVVQDARVLSGRRKTGGWCWS